MNGIKRSAIVTASVFAAVYLLGGFIAWDWNASHWEAEARAGVAFVGAFFSVIAVVIAAAVAAAGDCA